MDGLHPELTESYLGPVGRRPLVRSPGDAAPVSGLGCACGAATTTRTRKAARHLAYLAARRQRAGGLQTSPTTLIDASLPPCLRLSIDDLPGCVARVACRAFRCRATTGWQRRGIPDGVDPNPISKRRTCALSKGAESDSATGRDKQRIPACTLGRPSKLLRVTSTRPPSRGPDSPTALSGQDLARMTSRSSG